MSRFAPGTVANSQPPPGTIGQTFQRLTWLPAAQGSSANAEPLHHNPTCCPAAWRQQSAGKLIFPFNASCEWICQLIAASSFRTHHWNRPPWNQLRSRPGTVVDPQIPMGVAYSWWRTSPVCLNGSNALSVNIASDDQHTNRMAWNPAGAEPVNNDMT
jgi:hypothetical protein